MLQKTCKKKRSFKIGADSHANRCTTLSQIRCCAINAAGETRCASEDLREEEQVLQDTLHNAILAAHLPCTRVPALASQIRFLDLRE